MSAWPLVRLGDCTEIVSGSTPKTSVGDYWDGDLHWATPKDLSDLDGHRIAETARRLTAAGLRSCGASVLPSGSVLFSSRAPIGLVAVNTVPMATNQGFKSFIPRRDLLDSGYLAHWLRANRKRLDCLGNGATFKEVSKAVVSRVEIPLPPVSEQRRIAEVLDRADALRAKRGESLALLDNLVQSIFIDVFGDPSTNPLGWDDTCVLGDVADIASGITVGRPVPCTETRPVPYLAVSNVKDRYLDLTRVKEIAVSAAEVDRYRLRRDDLLLTEGGDPDKLGRGWLWAEQIEECLHQNHVFRVRVRDARATPLFVTLLLASQRGRAYFQRAAKQTTGIASINMTQMKAFPLLLPPLRRQTEFAGVYGAVALSRRLAAVCTSEADGMFLSLQQRAFLGEL